MVDRCGPTLKLHKPSKLTQLAEVESHGLIRSYEWDNDMIVVGFTKIRENK